MLPKVEDVIMFLYPLSVFSTAILILSFRIARSFVNVSPEGSCGLRVTAICQNHILKKYTNGSLTDLRFQDASDWPHLWCDIILIEV